MKLNSIYGNPLGCYYCPDVSRKVTLTVIIGSTIGSIGNFAFTVDGQTSNIINIIKSVVVQSPYKLASIDNNVSGGDFNCGTSRWNGGNISFGRPGVGVPARTQVTFTIDFFDSISNIFIRTLNGTIHNIVSATNVGSEIKGIYNNQCVNLI